jgi:hypothetical protein
VGDITGADLRRAKLFPHAWIFFQVRNDLPFLQVAHYQLQRTVWDFKQQSVSPFGWEEFSGLKDEPYVWHKFSCEAHTLSAP